MSESSYLLVSPHDAYPDLFRPSRWLYVLPLLALADLITSVVLGILIAGKEEMGLVVWGAVRAATVGWIGWGKGVRRGGSGGGGLIAGESELLVFLPPEDLWLMSILTGHDLPLLRDLHGELQLSSSSTCHGTSSSS